MKTKIPEALRKKLSAAGKKGWQTKLKNAENKELKVGTGTKK